MLPREMKVSEVLAEGNIAKFAQRHFSHFNAAALKNATEGYLKHLKGNGYMFLAMAGAMSTAEIGKSLAEMIRKKKIHGISCTGANLEEDVFNLVAHDSYVNLPKYRDLTPEDEKKLKNQNLNRVTDVAIPEKEAMTPIEKNITDLWIKSQRSGIRKFPHEFLYELLLSKTLEPYYQIDPKDSWMLAAAEMKLPLYVPGWEDSTLGNVFAAMCIEKKLKPNTVRSGIEYMMNLAEWYTRTSIEHPLGFFQIGGGIAGDFPICVVPLLMQDMKKKNTKYWSYFCQISDAVESYGGYSGASANEKITWGKIEPKTPKFSIQSDASIVVPLIFSMILGH